MSTIFVLTDSEERQGAVDTLLDGLDRLWPGQITTCRALAITTGVPQILDLLTSLANPVQATLPEAGAPATSPAKKARRQPRVTEKPGSNGSSGLPELAHVERQIAELEAEPVPAGDPPVEEAGEKNASAQFYNWRIMASGKECNSLSSLMRHRKLRPGDRAMHKTLGLHEVCERGDGSLYLHRVTS